MPINPEYIPLPKRKEMFAVTSWRDSPAVNTTPAAHTGVSPGPHPSSLDALRSNKCLSGIYTASVAGVITLPPASPPVEDGKDIPKTKVPLPPAAEVTGKKKKRKTASGATASGTGTGAHSEDVNDFFVHILLPSCISVQTLEFELQAQTTPLRSIDVGLPKVLFPRKPPGGDASPPTAPHTKTIPSPFRTPAGNPTVNEKELPPMSLPPADLSEPAAAVQTNGEGSALAATASGGHHGEEYQVSLLFAEKAEAEKTVAFVQRRWPTATVSLVSRNRSVLNATLVLKGMPNQTKTETVLVELQKLSHAPSYVRLLRSERGVFKGVVFVKYSNCEVAEECKLRLEKFALGARPLKVEFKKKSTAASNANGTVSESKRSLQELVRELRVSLEHEGFHLSRTDVAKEELKLLKQLCQSYGLLFDMNDHQVTVRRVLGSNGTPSEKPSPALRPQSTAPAWAPATPAPLRPMDFKGISHWKDIRSQASTLGIIRPLGPEDGKPAFSVGRGRPL